MKVLFITNLFPFPQNPISGIHITNRLKSLQSLDMNFDVYGITSKDTFGVKFLKKILSKTNESTTDSFYELDGVKYKYVNFSRNVIDIFNTKILKRNKLIENSKEVAEDLFDKIKDNEFDIIHAHGMYNNSPAGLVAKLLSVLSRK